jgi:hypothetical protein
MVQSEASEGLDIFLIGGSIVDRSRMAAATSTRSGTVHFSSLDGSPAALEELNRSGDANSQQLVVVDLALDGWEGIVSALKAQHRSGAREIAVLVGTADTKRLSAARRLGVTGLLLKPISSEHVRLLAADLHLAWPLS